MDTYESKRVHVASHVYTFPAPTTSWYNINRRVDLDLYGSNNTIYVVVSLRFISPGMDIFNTVPFGNIPSSHCYLNGRERL